MYVYVCIWFFVTILIILDLVIYTLDIVDYTNITV